MGSIKKEFKKVVVSSWKELPKAVIRQLDKEHTNKNTLASIKLLDYGIKYVIQKPKPAEKVVWVDNWKDLPKHKGKGQEGESGWIGTSSARQNKIWLVKGKATAETEWHERYHLKKRHGQGGLPKRSRDFLVHEIRADVYAFNHTGNPKHCLPVLRALYRSVGRIYGIAPAQRLRDIRWALIQGKAPPAWMADFKNLEASVGKFNAKKRGQIQKTQGQLDATRKIFKKMADKGATKKELATGGYLKDLPRIQKDLDDVKKGYWEW
jgi:hypothetical protein